MTKAYYRSELFQFNELSEETQKQVLSNYCFEISDAHQTQYVKFKDGNNIDFLPLCMFIRTERGNNFTHGIYGLSYFSCFTITFDRTNQVATIAYKYF